jgi:hypothetical protein
MASHFVSLNRGQDGFRYDQFVTGAASSANIGLELRLDDAAAYTRKDVVTQLQAFIRFFENPQQVSPAGFVVSG